MEIHPDLASRHNFMTDTSCCEYGTKTPDDGQKVCPKHVEFFTKIKTRNSVELVCFYRMNDEMHM